MEHEALEIQHHISGLLGDIVLILILSGFIIPALQIKRISPVLGYLFCGLILGPQALGQFAGDYPLLAPLVVADTKLVGKLAELGVVFLLFMIGLELTFSRLWELRKLVLGLGSAQILVTALIIGALASLFGNPLQVSILVGMAFALSSTAIVMQLLAEHHLIARPVGRICFSVLLMQDLAVVPILVLIGAFAGSGEGGIATQIFSALAGATLVVGIMILAGRKLLRPLMHFLAPARNAEWMFAIMLLLVIGCAALTESFGLSAALGAFLAGILVAETEYRHEVSVIIAPVKGLLMGVFFLSVGMATDITAILQNPFWLPASVIGIFIIKALCFYPLARMMSVPPAKAARASVYLAQCGEFAFIVIGIALAGGLLPAHDAQFFLLVAAVSMLLTPMSFRLAPVAEKWAVSAKTSDTDSIPEQPGLSPLDGGDSSPVIIAGFGRVGQTLAHILETQQIPYIAVDRDAVLVSQMNAKGFPVVVGNVIHEHLWEILHADIAKAAVITIDDYSVTDRILPALRKRWPLLPVIVRVRDNIRLERYFDAGATAVVPEAFESSLRLVRILLEKTGVQAEEAENIVERHRQENYAASRTEKDRLTGT